jgi:hypothetical protein
MHVRETEEAIMNGQSGEICNIAHKRKKKITTTPITLKMNNMDPTKNKGEGTSSPGASSSCFL